MHICNGREVWRGWLGRRGGLACRDRRALTLASALAPSSPQFHVRLCCSPSLCHDQPHTYYEKKILAGLRFG